MAPSAAAQAQARVAPVKTLGMLFRFQSQERVWVGVTVAPHLLKIGAEYIHFLTVI